MFSRNLFCGQLIKVPKLPEVSNNAPSEGDVDITDHEEDEACAGFRSRTNVQKYVTFQAELHDYRGTTSQYSPGDTGDAQCTTDSTYSSEFEESETEEHDPVAAQYLKMHAEYVIDLHISVGGLLLISSNSISFTPTNRDQSDVEAYNVLVSMTKIRSVAAYEDDSVMYFTKRDIHLKRDWRTHISVEDIQFSIRRSQSLVLVAIPQASCKKTRSLPQMYTGQSASTDPLLETSTTEELSPDEYDAKVDSRIRESKASMEASATATALTQCLCVLATKDNASPRRHPQWFTLQSEEYWFRIPEDKSMRMYDFLEKCKFPKIDPHQSSNKTNVSDLSRTLEFNQLYSGDSGTGSFIVVPKTFVWVLPRIGTLDEAAQIMLKHGRLLGTRQSPPQGYQSDLPFSRERNFETKTHAHKACMSNKCTAEVPSLEEEKVALQTLKRDSVRWELVNSDELELMREDEKKHKFIMENLILSVPTRLPIPSATASSKILDRRKVRHLMINLPPEAEGLDWQIVYSTSMHGFSLRTLYHRCSMSTAELQSERTDHQTLTSKQLMTGEAALFSSSRPCILLVLTSSKKVFGAMLSTHPHLSGDRFYGNGSCYVFRWIRPDRIGPIVSAQKEQLQQNADPPNDAVVDGGVKVPESEKEEANICSDTESSCSGETGAEISQELARYLQLDGLDQDIFQDKKESHPKFEKFEWTGKNSFFINGEVKSLNIGCSHGHCAIQLDDMLFRGRSEHCDTFDNPPLCQEKDFHIREVEIWSFK